MKLVTDTGPQLPVSDTSFEGLASAEAHRRARRYGRNILRPRVERAPWHELLRRFRNPLVLILLAASVLSAFTGEIASFVIIVAMVALSIAIDFVQEHRAGRAAEALIHRVQVHARVLRDGREVSLPVAQVVPGDVVMLAAGSVVPADGRLLAANGIHVNEALLTGEPFPVERSAGEAMLGGTAVVSGAGSMEVERTGAATEIARIAASLASEPPPTSFERGTRAFGMLVMRMTALLVLFVLLASAALGRPILESFLFALALAVGLTPELLPMIVTVTLARGATRLARAHVIVKRLTAIEGLGGMDVLCTDKTGTLTEARIGLERAVDAQGKPCEKVRELAYLNSFFQAGIRNPLDEAILSTPAVDTSAWRVIAEAPFDFERRRVGVVIERPGERLLVVKGAAEELLALCEPDAAARGAALQALEALGARGLRVIGVASKTLGAEESDPRDEARLSLAGFAAFEDPPKAGAAQAIRAMAESGVRIKILTGDGEAVTRHLCAQVGVAVDGVLMGADLPRLDDRALAARAETVNLFCRMNPAQKERVVRVLKTRGHVVGYIGDGVNDAPALHSADVGISVDNAVDVAKEAADIILLRRELGVVLRGAMEGRRTFVNIRKYLLMGTSSNFGNMFSMAGAAVFLPFLPLLPAQVLLNNLLYDVSEVPIPLDGADAEEIARPQTWDMGLVRDFMWVLGPVSSLFDFLTFYVLLAWLDAGETLFRTGWFVESLATQVLVIFVIRTRGSAWKSRAAPALVATSIAVVALAVALPYTPLAGLLGFEPPPLSFLLALAGLTAAYLVLAEVVKRAFYRRRAAHARPAAA
jgi:P-type Mg2+ transporter